MRRNTHPDEEKYMNETPKNREEFASWRLLERPSKQEGAARRTTGCFAFFLPQEGGEPRIELEFDQAELKY